MRKITTHGTRIDPNSGKPEFPYVHIHGWHEPEGPIGRAHVGKVVVRWDPDTETSQQDGEFQIELNRWHLGARNSEPVF